MMNQINQSVGAIFPTLRESFSLQLYSESQRVGNGPSVQPSSCSATSHDSSRLSLLLPQFSASFGDAARCERRCVTDPPSVSVQSRAVTATYGMALFQVNWLYSTICMNLVTQT